MKFENSERTVIITRGTSGAGKTTFCDIIAEPKIICCADDHFYKDGVYTFVLEELGHAHKKCQNKFNEALDDNRLKNIIVANTNVSPRDFAYYVMRAEQENIKVTYVVIEKRHDNINSHACPEHVLELQERNLRSSLKLR